MAILAQPMTVWEILKQPKTTTKCCLKIAKELGDRLGKGKAYCNLGNSHLNLGEFEKAFDCHESYLKIATEVGDKLAFDVDGR